MTKEQRKLYNSWSKMDIYEAYLNEHDLRLRQKKEITNLQDKLAFIRFNLKRVGECIILLKQLLKQPEN